MYHINLRGEANECKARHSCPFGDLDKDHFTTKEQAQAAYEAAQEGKAIASFKKREAHFEALSAIEKEELKAKQKRMKFLQQFEKPSIQFPIMPEAGYAINSPYHEELKAGDELSEDRVVTSVKVTGSQVTVYYKTLGEPDKRVRDRFTVTTETSAATNVWREGVQPEAQEAYKTQLKEYMLEDSHLNFATIDLTTNIRSRFSDNKTVRDYIVLQRTFKAKLKNFKKAGISLPHSRAYNDTLISPVSVGYTSRAVFEAIMTQNKFPGNDFYSSINMALKEFPKGKRMFIDFDPKKLLQERQENNLL